MSHVVFYGLYVTLQNSKLHSFYFKPTMKNDAHRLDYKSKLKNHDR